MKTNIFRALMVFIGFFACLLFPGRSMASVEIDGIFYELNTTDRTAVVSTSEGTYSGDIVIPESILYDGTTFSVNSIDNTAFEGCSGVTSVTIPSSVVHIGYFAFYRCNGLTSLLIPESVNLIGDRAFANCENLGTIVVDLNNTKYDSRNNCNAIIETATNRLVTGCINTTIPNGVTSIGSGAFCGCIGLTSIEIPNGVTAIDNFAFYGCKSLASITIPNSVESIGEDVFAYCSGMESMKVGINNIYYDSRNNCNAIIEKATNTLLSGCKSTIIPSGVNTIGSKAFRGCENLVSISIPDGVEKIDAEAFLDCIGLNSVSISGSVVTIEEGAFEACLNLESVELNNGLKNIKRRAFANCLSLKSLFIPRSVISLDDDDKGQSAFFSNFSLESIVVESGNSVFDSRDNCNAIIKTSTNTLLYGCKNTIIPNSVETIGDGAFMRQNYLESIVIPEGVKRIGDGSFRECDNLQSITLPSTLQSIGNCAFIYNDNFRICFSYLQSPIDLIQPLEVENLYVLKGTRELYLQNEWWNRCANIIEMDGDEIPSDEEVLATGQCGDNVTYTIYSDHSMVISGTGAMYDYSYSCINNDFSEYIQELTIEEGITNIGAFAFYHCRNITSVTIPFSVTTIGDYAFFGCNSLTSVTIPGSVTSIGRSSFDNCIGLTSLTIPNSVTKIGMECFHSTGLTSLIIPSSVTSIGDGAFSNCVGLTSIFVDPENNYFDSRNNCSAIIKKSNNTLIAGCMNSIIPNSVTAIGDYAFTGCRVSSITIPNSVTHIGVAAFSGCIGLTSLIIPNSVTSIGGNAFSYCSNLKSVNISNSLTEISHQAFEYCSGLTSLTIPTSVTIIGTFAFEYCSGLTSITIPNSVTNIDIRALSGCTGLTSLTIPKSVTSIGSSAFKNCTGLTSIFVENETPISCNNPFENINKSTCILYVPIGSKSAYENAEYWNEFENIVELDAESDEDVLASGQCGDNLTYTIYSDMSMVISGTGAMWDYDYYEHISDEYYQSIQKVIIEEGVTTIGLRAFCDWSGLNSVTISNTVTDICSVAFSGCISLTSLTIPSSVNNISLNVFPDCSGLTSITVDEGNPIYDSRDNCNAIIETRYNKLVLGCMNTVIPNSVTEIGWLSFKGCSSLTSIIIPNNVKRIDYRAFDGCTGLTSIEIPSSVTSISENIVANCSNLATITIDVNNPNYDSRNNCNAIIETSSNKLISGCMNTIIPDGIFSIERSAFCGCTGLTSIELPNTLSSIGDFSFDGCSNLASITIPDGVTYLGISAFEDCNSLTTVKIPNSVTSTLSQTFLRCTSLTSVLIGYGVTTIDNSAFYGCSNLNTIFIPNSVTSIGDSAFGGCSGLNSITVESSTPTTVSSWSSFYKVNKSTCTLYVPKGSKSAYENAEYWNDFENIVEIGEEPDTDISKYDNIVYIEGAEVVAGQRVRLSLKMNNTIAPTGFQCDIYLPDGVTPVMSKDEDGKDIYLMDISTERTTSDRTNVSDCVLQADGSLRFLCNSMKSYTIRGNEGEVAYLMVDIDPNLEEGTYPLILKNVIISDANAGKYTVDYVKTTLQISTYTVGDANNDSDVDVADFTAIANYILNRPSVSFVEKAADVNADDEIDVADLTGVANLILYGTVSPNASHAKARNDVAAKYASIEAKDVTATKDEEFTVVVTIDGNYAYSGYQFDVTLPEGMTVKDVYGQTKASDVFMSGMIDDNTLRVLCASIAGETAESAVVNLTLVADIEGTYSIDIDNATVSVNASSCAMLNSSFVVGVGCEANGINYIGDERGGNDVVYDLAGNKVNYNGDLSIFKKGIYIINGKKVSK